MKRSIKHYTSVMNNKDSIVDYKVLSEHCDKSISVGECIARQVKTHLDKGWEPYGAPQFKVCEGGYDIFQIVVRKQS